MNRQKSAPRTRISTYVALIGTGIIVAGGGVLHAVYKNCQIQVTREIDAVESRIVQCQLDIRITQMRSEDLLNRFTIQKQLIASGSPLRSIPVGLAEEVTSAPPTAVAAINP